MLQRISLIFRSPTLVLLCIIVWVAGARPQGRCDAELAKAEQAYNEGLFDQVINLVKTCLSKSDLTTAEQAWAYKLLGQVYVSRNEPQPARIFVQKLLEVAPDYEPDRDQDLQMWIELVEAAKQERERQIQQQQLPKPADDKPIDRAHATQKGGGKKWLWLGGGGTLVTAGIVYVLVSQKEPKESREPIGFPDPPGRP